MIRNSGVFLRTLFAREGGKWTPDGLAIHALAHIGMVVGEGDGDDASEDILNQCAGSHVCVLDEVRLILQQSAQMIRVSQNFAYFVEIIRRAAKKGELKNQGGWGQTPFHESELYWPENRIGQFRPSKTFEVGSVILET